MALPEAGLIPAPPGCGGLADDGPTPAGADGPHGGRRAASRTPDPPGGSPLGVPRGAMPPFSARVSVCAPLSSALARSGERACEGLEPAGFGRAGKSSKGARPFQDLTTRRARGVSGARRTLVGGGMWSSMLALRDPGQAGRICRITASAGFRYVGYSSQTGFHFVLMASTVVCTKAAHPPRNSPLRTSQG
jgi:hypothetical protein